MNRNSTKIIFVAVVVLAVLIGAYFFLGNKPANAPVASVPQGGTQGQTAQPFTTGAAANNTAPVIKNDQGLASASQALDAADLGQLDSAINQNNADAQTFAPRIRNRNGTSLNWSGYAVETNIAAPQSGVVSDVKGGWTVPALACGSTNTYSSAWVGIDGYSDNTVEQLGTEHDCLNGAPSYYAWYEMYPKPSFRINLTVKAGDAISAEVQYLSGNKFRLTITDATTGKSFATTQKSNAARQSAEWIVEAPWSGGVLPLADFGTIPFSNAYATLNGRTGTISDASWQNDPITMTDSSGIVKAAPSPLSPDGSGFSVAWQSSN